MGGFATLLAASAEDRKWRNRDLQNGRQQCLLSGSGNSHLNGRYEAQS